jgi:hypothetical protein
MNWDQLQPLSRYATTEVFTVAGVLLGGLAAWKAVGWAVRAVGALLGRFSFAPLMMSLLFVGGAATTGWGLARWGGMELRALVEPDGPLRIRSGSLRDPQEQHKL